MSKGGAAEEEAGVFPQAWSDGGSKRCPAGTVPIRRTAARDVLRASSARRFGMKARGGGSSSSNARRDSTSSGHEVSESLCLISHRLRLRLAATCPPAISVATRETHTHHALKRHARPVIKSWWCCNIKAGLVGGENTGVSGSNCRDSLRNQMAQPCMPACLRFCRPRSCSAPAATPHPQATVQLGWRTVHYWRMQCAVRPWP
jgi:hypothetical protein